MTSFRESAEKAIQNAKDFRAPSDFAQAQVYATLALVEQQRIANLIALGSLTAWDSEMPASPIEHLAFTGIGDPDLGKLRPEIADALGIEDEA